MNIVKDKKLLSIPIPNSELSSERIDEISDILKTELKNHGNSRVGLAANQLGLGVRMCIVDVKEPLILVNPRFVSKSDRVVAYHEQCLSIDRSMKKPIQVKRHAEVTIMTDNLGELTFKPDTYEWRNSNEFYSDRGMLESACVQHEIDHLDGITIESKLRKWFVPMKSEKTYRRNDRVMVKFSDGTTEFMKYKKAQTLPQNEIEIM